MDTQTIKKFEHTSGKWGIISGDGYSFNTSCNDSLVWVRYEPTTSTKAAYTNIYNQNGTRIKWLSNKSGYEYELTLSEALDAGYTQIRIVSHHASSFADAHDTYYDIVTVTQYRLYLKFDANSGSGAPSTQNSGWKDSQSATFTISSTEPTRDGYTFIGWSTSQTAISPDYNGGSSITITSDTTLYAVWKRNTPPIKVNVNNTWKEASGIYVNVNGTWKTATTVYANVNGSWKEAK